MIQITELTQIEYLEFQKEYNEYLDGVIPKAYTGSNPKIHALARLIQMQPSRQDDFTIQLDQDKD